MKRITWASVLLFALFDDYSACGMDFGYRQYVGSAVAPPYIGAGGGAHINLSERFAVQGGVTVRG